MLSRQPDRHQGMHYPFIGNPAGRGLPRDAGKAHQTQVASLLPDVAHSKVEPIIPRHVWATSLGNQRLVALTRCPKRLVALTSD